MHIDPFAIVEENVKLGDNTVINAYAHIKPYTTIGENCKIFQGAIIGEIPQDLKFNGEQTELIIGDSTIIREYCTLNRGTADKGITTIGSNCLLMAYVHVAHDCIVNDHTILANGVQLGGHVEIGKHVTIGGMTPVHQFCHIGDHSFIGGGLRVVQDVPPYILAMGEPLKFSGLNSIGLKRKNFDAKTRTKIKEVYKYIYQSNMNRSQAISQIQKSLNQIDEIKNILKFINNSSRGLI